MAYLKWRSQLSNQEAMFLDVELRIHLQVLLEFSITITEYRSRFVVNLGLTVPSYLEDFTFRVRKV